MSAAEPYERLAALAERELALLADGAPAPEQLEQLIAERDALVASLPSRAPQAAAPALARAAALQERVTMELAARAAEVRRTLGEAERGRRTAHGYGAGVPASGTLDLAG